MPDVLSSAEAAGLTFPRQRGSLAVMPMVERWRGYRF
jgi:hypothetical protein